MYKARINQQQAGKIRGKISNTKDRVKHNLDSCNTRLSNSNKIFEGRKIIHKKTLAEGLICIKCNAVLSLLDATDEEKWGLASIFLKNGILILIPEL